MKKMAAIVNLGKNKSFELTIIVEPITLVGELDDFFNMELETVKRNFLKKFPQYTEANFKLVPR